MNLTKECDFMNGIKNMLLGIAIMLAVIVFHLFCANDGLWTDFIAIIYSSALIFYLHFNGCKWDFIRHLYLKNIIYGICLLSRFLWYGIVLVYLAFLISQITKDAFSI